jgi:hypothetical protein
LRERVSKVRESFLLAVMALIVNACIGFVRKKELEKKISLIPTILSKNLSLESELKSEEQQSKIDETRKDLISLKSSLKSMISEESNKTRQELILIVSTHLSNPNLKKEVEPANIISIQDYQKTR